MNKTLKVQQVIFLPSLSANVGHNITFGNAQLFPGQFVDRTAHSTNAGISVNQTIFDGFRNTFLYKQSKLNLEQNQYELNRIRDNIALNVVNAYLNILFNKENLEIAKVQYDFSEKQLNQVKEFVDAGVQARADIFDSEATLANNLQSVTVAENNYDLALLSLSQLLQIPFDGFAIESLDIGDPSETLLYESITPVLEHALENRNEIKVAETSIKNAELSTKLSKAGYYPTVTAGYGFSSNVFYSNLDDSEDTFFNQLNDQKKHTVLI